MRKYRCKANTITFDEKGAHTRLNRAVLLPDGDDIYGYTDGRVIVINESMPMGFWDVVATLVHEALHNYCYVRGKKMGCDREHMCMIGLGEKL